MNIRNFQELMAPIKADPERRANLERHRAETLAEIVAYNLAELRRIRDVTQTELADALGVRQSSVSGIEHGDDPHLSTLRGYVEALGGRIEVMAVFGDERFPIVI